MNIQISGVRGHPSRGTRVLISSKSIKIQRNSTPSAKYNCNVLFIHYLSTCYLTTPASFLKSVKVGFTHITTPFYPCCYDVTNLFYPCCYDVTNPFYKCCYDVTHSLTSSSRSKCFRAVWIFIKVVAEANNSTRGTRTSVKRVAIIK